MADLEQVERLLTDVESWNLWRSIYVSRRINLSEADLSGANLTFANLRKANRRGTDLSGADLRSADLIQANLRKANLSRANLIAANLSDANLTDANLDECEIFAISAWRVRLDGATQTNLRITPSGEPKITVDNLEVAQFLYLMLHNDKIHKMLETITSKVVLILGRFSDERKLVLDALRVALRRHPNHYVPVLFDFDLPAGKHILETVGLLARLARFVIADITDPSMVRVELALIAPILPSVPIQPLLLASEAPMAEYPFYQEFPWVLPLYRYEDLQHLISTLDKVISPAEQRIQTRATWHE
jgi:hypothetical protein